MLDREAILAAADLPAAPVEAPEWGEGAIVHVRTLSAFEAEQKFKGIDKLDNFLGRFAALVICRPDGGRMFRDEDAEALGKKNLAAIRRIVDAAQKLNGMTKDAQEETEKNSETIGDGSSSSGSPASLDSSTPIECSKP